MCKSVRTFLQVFHRKNMLNYKVTGRRFLLAPIKYAQLSLGPCVKPYQTNLLRHLVSSCVLPQQSETSSQRYNSYEEVKIPMPWGTINGKWWGNRNETPLIGLHGFEDNAGTFDRIAPLLNVPAFLAWDAPGHGKSSKFPRGSSYSFVDFVLCLRQVVLHFGWKKISILGHSYGSSVGSVYAALHPNEVNSLIRLEDTSIVMHLNTKGFSTLRKAFDNNIKSDSMLSESPPGYTWEELLTVFCNASRNSVSRDYAHHILKRGVTKHPKFADKYFFSRDPKLRFGDFNHPDSSLHEECAQNVKCPVLTIYGTEGYIKVGSKLFSNTLDLCSRLEKILEMSAVSYERYDLSGTHHLHLNNPEPVAKIVTKFLSHNLRSSV